jgi:hypothetical protein
MTPRSDASGQVVQAAAHEQLHEHPGGYDCIWSQVCATEAPGRLEKYSDSWKVARTCLLETCLSAVS